MSNVPHPAADFKTITYPPFQELAPCSYYGIVVIGSIVNRRPTDIAVEGEVPGNFRSH
jgi:hypothetical protein